MNKLSSLAKRVKCSAEYGNVKEADLDDWQRAAHPYRVTLRYKRRQMGLDFFMGPALTDEPDAAGVLSCLMSDASAAEQSFEEWCGDLGFDTDSRKAERMYRNCLRLAGKLHKLLGDDYDLFRKAEDDI